MDFARKQLEKYGWSDGKGLGKHENGISEALKTKVKRSVAGIGHDPAKDFTEHWWTSLYNKAANNVEVEQNNGKTKKIKTKDNQEFEITNSMWKLHHKSKGSEENGEYKDFFVRTAVLANGGSKIENLKSDSDSDDDEEEIKDIFKMTDEELFAACGGRTAHKGARFGLKATGKLARIKQQEEILLNLDKYNGYSHAKKRKMEMSDGVKSKRGQKSNENEDSLGDSELIDDGDIKSKKILKKKNKKSVDLVEAELTNNIVNENDVVISKNELIPNNNKELENGGKYVIEPTMLTKKKKLKRRKSTNDDPVNLENIVESTSLDDDNGIILKKKSKKKKHNKGESI